MYPHVRTKLKNGRDTKTARTQQGKVHSSVHPMKDNQACKEAVKHDSEGGE